VSTTHQLKQLQTQNALLREKSIEARKENDLLVEKIQRLQSKISTEVHDSQSLKITDIIWKENMKTLQGKRGEI
jgi:hypothetical protein